MNSFGRIFRLSIFGESHGKIVGVCIDGCPAGIKINESSFTKDILRRKSGKIGTTPRIEDDNPEIISGCYNEYTTGAPLTILFKNKNVKSSDYENLINIPRPGHADFVASVKYKGYSDLRGGGHFSGRLTLPFVAAGVIAKHICNNISFEARLIEAGGISNIDEAINLALKNNDSIGGIIECVIKGLNVGLGQPFFDSLESLISHLVFSIPGVKGIEFGSGFNAAKMTGIIHNDSILNEEGKTLTNNAGGINGGISNGNDIVFRIAIKPSSSTPKKQKSINLKTKQMEDFEIEGRHDLCIALRVPVIVEAAAAIVIADLLLINKTE